MLHVSKLRHPWKTIISRHGVKGGRLIDGIFTSIQWLEKVTGIIIIPHTGINSDHSLVISKFDLGIKDCEASKEKEERFDFKRIMNITVRIGKGDSHPSLNDNVYKGDFLLHAQLYN